MPQIRSHRWSQSFESPTALHMQRESTQPGCGQTAAGVAADCTAVCCCCPFGLINLIYVVLIKLPVGIVVRSVRWVKIKAHKCRHESCSCKSRQRSLLNPCEDDSLEMDKDKEEDFVIVFDSTKTKEEIELERDMVKKLSGFGRSFSQREEYSAAVS